MSQIGRVKKLEGEADTGFKVICPTLLDANGSRFPASPPFESVMAISFGPSLTVGREDGEEDDEFKARAWRASEETVQATFILPLWAEWL